MVTEVDTPPCYFTHSRREISLILPEALEPLRSHSRIPDRVVDVAVPEVVLDGPCIMPLRGEEIPARMPKLMGMNREAKAGFFPGASDDVPDGSRRERRAPLRHEDIGRIRVVPLELAERAKLRASERMLRVAPALGTFDVQVPALQIHLAPLERHELGGAKPVAEHEQHDGGVALAVAPEPPGGFDEGLDLVGPQVLPVARGVLLGWRQASSLKLCRKRKPGAVLLP